jgi:hypothetical protein
MRCLASRIRPDFAHPDPGNLHTATISIGGRLGHGPCHFVESRTSMRPPSLTSESCTGPGGKSAQGHRRTDSVASLDGAAAARGDVL